MAQYSHYENAEEYYLPKGIIELLRRFFAINKKCALKNAPTVIKVFYDKGAALCVTVCSAGPVFTFQNCASAP
jgi:hypothetical protein